MMFGWKLLFNSLWILVEAAKMRQLSKFCVRYLSNNNNNKLDSNKLESP